MPSPRVTFALTRMEGRMLTRRHTSLEKIALFLIALAVSGVALERTLYAFTYLIDANGTYWGFQGNGSPYVDTGSIRGTQVLQTGGTGFSPNNAPFSTAINGYGGIRVRV